MANEANSLPAWFWPAIPIFFVGLWCGATFLLALVSGWRRLAAHYPGEAPTDGRRFRFRSARIGLVSYNTCLNFAAAPDGLHIWVLLPFRLGSPPLLVPWRDLSATPDRGWVVNRVALSFAQAPGIRFQIARSLGEEIAAASRGALRIGPE